jgi:hypothetical protein
MIHLKAIWDVADIDNNNQQQTDTPSSGDDGHSGEAGLELT